MYLFSRICAYVLFSLTHSPAHSLAAHLQGLTSDDAELDILLKDPHRYAGEVMNKTAFEVLTMINQVKMKVNTVVTMPVLLLHGSEDRLCFPDGSEWIRDHAGTPLEFTKMQIFKVICIDKLC